VQSFISSAEGVVKALVSRKKEWPTKWLNNKLFEIFIKGVNTTIELPFLMFCFGINPVEIRNLAIDGSANGLLSVKYKSETIWQKT
jgi:hypothetical protein